MALCRIRKSPVDCRTIKPDHSARTHALVPLHHPRPSSTRGMLIFLQALSATSEEEIAVNPKLCGKPKSDFMSQIRADFTVCSLPADSLTGTCISGSDNEPDECGFGTNLLGLCTYCASSSPNATDSCCVNSNAAGRCENVKLPTTPTTLPPLFPTSSSNSSATGAAASHGGLSGGQIAGIVIGSVAGSGALLALGVLLLICLRRRRDQHARNILNQPTPQRKGSPPMQYTRTTNSQQGIEVTPGGRVARMSALQTSSSHSPPRSRTSAARTKYSDSSDSETFGASPGSVSRRAPPVTSKRKASLSSHSMLGGETPRSGTAGQVSSPEGVASTLSEQLPFFRDYYSEDDIHPGDKVSVLWAYQPRAADEFELNRGEMLKVIAIWDDGWATGVRVPERAEDYDWRRRVQRDSGVSNGSERRGSSPQPTGEIKAFPVRKKAVDKLPSDSLADCAPSLSVSVSHSIGGRLSRERCRLKVALVIHHLECVLDLNMFLSRGIMS